MLRPAMRRTRRLLVVGSGEQARHVVEELKAHRGWDYQVVGYVDSEPQDGFVPPEQMLGGVDSLERILAHNVVDEVAIALPIGSHYDSVSQAVGICQMLGIRAQYSTDDFGTPMTKGRSYAGPERGRVVLEAVTRDWRLYLKRTLDIAISLLAIILLLPLFVAIAIAVKLTSPGPVLYRQQRYCLNKRTFFVLKFRSMCVDAEARMAALEHLNEAQGPAAYGRLWDVPTPIFERWVDLDLQYIDNWSHSLDLVVLMNRIPAVLSSRGAA